MSPKIQISLRTLNAPLKKIPNINFLSSLKKSSMWLLLEKCFISLAEGSCSATFQVKEAKFRQPIGKRRTIHLSSLKTVAQLRCSNPWLPERRWTKFTCTFLLRLPSRELRPCLRWLLFELVVHLSRNGKWERSSDECWNWTKLN